MEFDAELAAGDEAASVLQTQAEGVFGDEKRKETVRHATTLSNSLGVAVAFQFTNKRNRRKHMTGYRTAIVAAAVAIVGALQGLNLVQLIPDNPQVAGWIATGLGVVMFVLRAITTGPIGGGKP